MEKNSSADLYYNRAFMAKVNEFKLNIQPNTYSMVAIDIEHFRLFNKLYGRETGDELIACIMDIVKQIATEHAGIAGYMGGDNFAILMPDNMTLIQNLRDAIIAAVKQWNNSIGFHPLIGVYLIDDITITPEFIYDRATLALSQVPGKYANRICRYDSSMETRLEEEMQLLAEIQAALENEEFTFFCQPQCDIASGKIVGAEALARWIHPTRGVISPGVFIPILERNSMILLLDQYIWEKVCEWLHDWTERGYTPIPISINVSRIDIFSMNVPEYLFQLLRTYNIPPRLLKVEITESAYVESDDTINNTVQCLRDGGLTVMMDDFGCGYSSLNMLRNIPVDVIKLDMRFLDIAETDAERGIGILESIVNMARLMRLPIVAEGVETQTQEKFLLNAGCRYTQGYYYYKPLPLDQFESLLTDERRLDLTGLSYKQVEPLHVKEFLDDNFFSDMMLNNVLGPVAFYEMCDNRIEITRVNEQYFRLIGNSSIHENNYGIKFWNHVRDDDRALLYTIFENAYANPVTGADGYIHFLRMDGNVLWVYIKVFFLKEKEGRKQFYSSLMDMTSFQTEKAQEEQPPQEIKDISKEQWEQADAYYGHLPYGYAVAKILLNSSQIPIDFEIVYGNHELNQICAGDFNQLKLLALQAFSEKRQEFFAAAYKAAYLGETVKQCTYSNISNRYLEFTFYQYRYGYVGCTLSDITHTHIYENALNSITRSYREVYHVHLQDNYCRMIYPYESHISERGNYEETINRHFFTGKILPHDEKNVRKFLSLENLRQVLKTQDTTEYAYRRSYDNISEEWCLTSFNVSERDSNGNPLIAIMLIKSVDALMAESRNKRAQYLAETLASMSEGFLIYRAVDEHKVLYASPRVLQIFGCKNIEEFLNLVQSSFRGMVHPNDWARVDWEINDQVRHSDKKIDYIQYRIIRKDGEVRWIDDCGHLESASSSTDGGLFYVFISDITDTISEKEKTKLLNRNKYFITED